MYFVQMFKKQVNIPSSSQFLDLGVSEFFQCSQIHF